MAEEQPKATASVIDAALRNTPIRVSKAKSGLTSNEARTLVKATGLSVAEFNAHIAERMDGIIGKMVGRMEKEVDKFSISQLPLATAILADKAAQYRGQALASGGSTTNINIQVNGLDRDGMKQALAGVANMGRKGRSSAVVTAVGKLGPQEAVSPTQVTRQILPTSIQTYSQPAIEAELVPQPAPPEPTENSTSKGHHTQ